MMTGFVRSKGLPLSGKQVAKSLRRVNPADHARRREDTVRRRNPVPYNALYYGNKLHCDQNENLEMYGCTFYALSDGCSSRIIKLFSMPKKMQSLYMHISGLSNNQDYGITFPFYFCKTLNHSLPLLRDTRILYS